MYRLRLDTWPVLSDSQQGEAGDTLPADVTTVSNAERRLC